MNKKITIFSISLIIIGIIGTICSGIASIPYFIKASSDIEKELNKEYIIYNKEVDINKLNINTKDTNIVIRKHNKNNVIVSKKGNKDNLRYNIENKDNALYISENESRDNYKDIRSSNDFANYVFNEFYSQNTNNIVIYIPNDVDINTYTQSGVLDIQDDIFLNDVTFKTLSGNISLPKKIKSLNKLDIKSKNYTQLSISELLGIKDIYISSNSVNVYSDDNDIFIDNKENYIPNNVNINQDSNDYGNIDISTEIPIANNLNINAYKSNVSVDLPIDRYKINFNIKSLQQIDIDDLIQENKVNENDNLKYQGIKELNGNLNKNLDQLEKEYKVNIKSEYVSIK